MNQQPARRYQATYKERWPYAPLGITIRAVPARRYQTPWYGRYQYATRTVHLNTDCPPDAIDGVLAHELGHARWTAPLPQLDREEGSTQLILAALDEVRVHHWAVRSHPPVRQQLRDYLARTMPGTLTATNQRGYLLVYIYAYGQVAAGVYDPDEATHLATQLATAFTPPQLATLHQQLARALTIPPAQYGQLIRLARQLDATALNRTTPQTTAHHRTTRSTRP